FTDIVGSTDSARQHGDTRWTELLSGIDLYVAQNVRRHNGQLIKQTGDGHLVTFGGPTDAIRTGREIAAGSRGFGVDVRVGVHTAEVELRPGGDISGVAVHVAQRISALAAPGEV